MYFLFQRGTELVYHHPEFEKVEKTNNELITNTRQHNEHKHIQTHVNKIKSHELQNDQNQHKKLEFTTYYFQ